MSIDHSESHNELLGPAIPVPNPVDERSSVHCSASQAHHTAASHPIFDISQVVYLHVSKVETA